MERQQIEILMARKREVDAVVDPVFAVDLRKAARGEIQQGIPVDREAAELIPDVAGYFGTRKHLPA